MSVCFVHVLPIINMAKKIECVRKQSAKSKVGYNIVCLFGIQIDEAQNNLCQIFVQVFASSFRSLNTSSGTILLFTTCLVAAGISIKIEFKLIFRSLSLLFMFIRVHSISNVMSVSLYTSYFGFGCITNIYPYTWVHSFKWVTISFSVDCMILFPIRLNFSRKHNYYISFFVFCFSRMDNSRCIFCYFALNSGMAFF